MVRLILALSVAVLASGALAVAQENTDERIRKLESQLETLTKELKEVKAQKNEAALEEKIDDLKKKLDKIPGVSKEKPTMGYDKGFFIRSLDDQFEIKLGGRVQADWWMYEGGPIEPVWNNRVATGAAYPPNPIPAPGAGDMTDTFFIRRAYLTTTGYLWGKGNRFKIEEDFAGGSSNELLEAYMTLDYVPWLKVQFGQYKPPFGREHLMSDVYIPMAERSLIDDLLIMDRDDGIMAFGELFDGKFKYATGIFNGVPRNLNDNNDAKDWAYRMVFKPFKNTKNEWIEGFEIGHDFTIGEQPQSGGIRGRTAGDIDYFPSNVRLGPYDLGVATILPLRGRDTPANYATAANQVHGTRRRAGVDGAWFAGPFGLMGAYMDVVEDRHGIDAAGTLNSPYDLSQIEHKGWYVLASCVLTGEKKGFDTTVVPKVNFDPNKGGWGAWEVLTRVEGIEHRSADPILLYRYRDGFGNIRNRYYDRLGDTAFTLGVNWYLNPNMMVKWNWVHDWFDEKLMANGREADTVMTRFQVFW